MLTRPILSAFFLGTILTLSAWGQVSTAELAGTVADASGAVVAGAKVTLTNTATGVSRELISEATGSYNATLLPPGTYNIAVEAAGFRKLVQNNVELQVNQRARIDFALQLGQVSEVLEVSGTAPLLESSSSSLGSVIGPAFVNELPLNGRNFIQLAILSPGVNGAGYSVSGTIMSGTRPDDRRPGTEIFSNGNREGSNNFLYDGADNNERLTLSIVLRPGVEAIREFKVQTNLYSADLGRNSGAVVDVVSKSGSNDIHGSLFEFLRNSAMDARNFFNTKGTPFPSFRYNQFGGSFGGPILIPKIYNGKNKTFFFVDYEGFRRNQLNSFQNTIPTMAERKGDFSDQPNRIYDPLSTIASTASSTGFTRTQFPNNQIPASRFDPVTAKLIKAYPTPQNSSLTNNYLANLNQTQQWDQGDIRVDHQLSPSDTLFARWSIQHTTTYAPYTFPAVTIAGIAKPVGLGNEDSFAGPSFSPDQQAVASYVKVISPRVVNELRAGFSRFVLDYTMDGVSSEDHLGNDLGVPNSNTNPLQNGLPIFSPANYSGIGHSRSLPIFRRENTFHYADNVTWTAGKHTLKFGADFRRRQITEYQTNRGNGRFNFSPGFTNLPGVGSTGNSMASFLLGYATLIEQDFTLAWVGMRGIETGTYIADDWRVSRSLTLNFGLRWEYYSPYSEVANRWSNFDAATGTVLVAGRNGVDSRAGIQRDFKDFAPRFGFAYSVATHTVVRGGFGIFYNPNGNGGAALRLQRHAPYGPIYSVSPGDITVATRVSDGFPAPPTVNFDGLANPKGAEIGIIPTFRSAYAEQFNLSVQHEIAPMQLIVKAAYVGNLGRRLSTTYNLNQPIPGPTSVASRRPYFNLRPSLSDVTYAVSDGLSNYHSFQLTVEKRMSAGLQFLAGYTWAHAIDNVATDFGGGTGTPQDPRYRNVDRGNAAFDLRHRFTISSTYRLPFGKGARFLSNGRFTNVVFGGWQINAIATVQTGLPFTPGLATSTTNGTGSRPDGLRDATLPADQRSLKRWFDPTAFGTPAAYTYGNLGRDTLFGPGRVNFDSSLFKDFQIHEGWKMQFRAESFNMFNHPQFGQPNASIGSSAAGVISGTVGNPRQMQLALRLAF